MATTEPVGAPPTFEIVGLPQAMAVKDPDTGRVVDGYRLNVKSLSSGATAIIEVPADKISVVYVKEQAEKALAPLDASLAAFGRRTG